MEKETRLRAYIRTHVCIVTFSLFAKRYDALTKYVSFDRNRVRCIRQNYTNDAFDVGRCVPCARIVYVSRENVVLRV